MTVLTVIEVKVTVVIVTVVIVTAILVIVVIVTVLIVAIVIVKVVTVGTIVIVTNWNLRLLVHRSSLTIRQKCDVLEAAFCDLAMFW